MTLTPGTRLGPYEVVAPLGAGGMGEVYRAKDTKLNRDVAIKVLPELFALDADRVVRFTREAQVLASLNHPNIAAIYGIEANALVMELVEGEDLSAPIARGAIALSDALPIAKQIADALEAAHEQGIVHRDLKPQNIKVRADGTVKVLDFGLAKAMDQTDGAGGSAMNSPTMTARATAMGMIIGTAAYMAPEQAKGRAVDRRADIWAFGVVLMEMLTGQQVFAGETVSEVMASVMKDEPDWQRLPATVPAAVRRVLRRCLEKDPKRRMSAIGDARFELTDVEAPSAMPTGSLPRRLRWPVVAAALAGAAVVAVSGLYVVPMLQPTPVREPSRVSVLGPSGVALAFDSAESAISPDGRTLVFTTSDPNGSTRLWMRPLASTTARVIPGTESGRLPFWSPDSKNIAFFGDDKLKRVSVDGGPVAVLCDAKDGRGGTWGAGDVIVFAPASAGPLQQVPSTGGTPVAVTTLDAARGENSHRFPSFLPDGRHFLYASLPARNLKFDLFLGALDGTRIGPVTTSEAAAVYADPGYLIFSRSNVVVAQRFDVSKGVLAGEPVTLGDAPGSQGGTYTSSPPVSVSRTGTLAYLGDGFAATTLRWLDRTGRETGTLAAPEGRYQEIAISPDGTRAAITRFTSQNASDIWIADVARGGATRFTSAPGGNVEPVWSPDGTRIVFASDREGPRDFWLKPASGAVPEEKFFGSQALFKDIKSWSPDGALMVYEQLDPQTNRDLWILPVTGDRTPRLYLRTPYNEVQGTVSPDGRWLAYLSDESGRYELYVDAFPTPRGRFRVTDSGVLLAFWGNNITWRRDGRELAMIGSDRRTFLTAEVSTGATFHASAPKPVFLLPKETVAAQATPDLQKILVAVPASENTQSTLTLVFDWSAALGSVKK